MMAHFRSAIITYKPCFHTKRGYCRSLDRVTTLVDRPVDFKSAIKPGRCAIEGGAHFSLSVSKTQSSTVHLVREYEYAIAERRLDLMFGRHIELKEQVPASSSRFGEVTIRRLTMKSSCRRSNRISQHLSSCTMGIRIAVWCRI